MTRDRIEGKRNPFDMTLPRPILGCALAVLLALAAPAALPQEMAPDALLKSVTLDVLAVIRADKDIRAGDPAKVADLVELKILPHFDFPRMTQIAMGRNWRLAAPAQQAALTAEFRTLLVRTYSTALSAYRDQVIEFRPSRAVHGGEITVRSVIRQTGSASIAMDYDMERLAQGWKVFDIKIDGMSLVTTYRETFAGLVRDGGVDGLLRTLTEKNRQGDARFRSHRIGEFHLPALLIHADAAWRAYISHSR